MKTSINKFNSRTWEWTITRGEESLAGGFAATKAAAENDSAIVFKDIERTEARRDGRIAEGDKVTIKPEWQDAGDDQYDWFAIETQLVGARHIKARAVSKATGENSIGIMSLELEHLVR